MDAQTLLLAGGIAEATAEIDGVATDPVEARVYAHPALLGRKVVRLTAEAVGDATDVEMSVLGFDAPSSSSRVGRSVLRALGFPAWAVVHDPKNARFALEVMQEFRKAARRIRSKPGFARDELVAIAKRLERAVPHFLPSFWEEAGRAYAAEASLTFAAQCFEKARAAETAFKLTVDEDQRSRTYLEFALAGALATKSLTGYASDLAAAYGAKEGYRRFFELAVQRTRGGVPPWAGVAKDLRRLAKGAGIAADAADRDFVEAVLGSPSMTRAPLDFWSSYAPCLVAMARADGAVRARLRWLFPSAAGSAWIGILEASGATDAFVVGHADAASEAHGAAARWAAAFVLHARPIGYGARQATTAETFPVLAKVAPRIAAEGVPALLASATGYWLAFDVDVLEKALELGIPLAEGDASAVGPGGVRAPGPPRLHIDMRRPFELDPVRVAAHPAYGPALATGVVQAVGHAEFEARAPGKKGLVEARRTWLDGVIARLAAGAVPSFRHELGELEGKTSAATFEEFPEAAAALRAASPAEALRRTLEAGVLDEFGWPDFERVTAKLWTKKDPLGLFGTIARPIVWAGSKAIVFDGAGEAAEVSIPAAIKHVAGLLYVNGALLAQYRDADYKTVAAWSTDWSASFACDPSLGEVAASVTLADGSVSVGGRAVHVGDQVFGAALPLVSDGETCWVCTRESWQQPITCVELDPKTGAKGRASWPKFLRAATEIDDDKRMQLVTLLPAPKGAEASPLGVSGSLLGWYGRWQSSYQAVEAELVRIDGVRWRGIGAPYALITFPGSDVPRALYVNPAWRPEMDAVITIAFDGRSTYVHGDADDKLEIAPIAGFARAPRPPWLHYLTPRDEVGSRALRGISTTACAALLCAADGEDEPAAARAKIEAALVGVVPAITHPHLRAGVALAVMMARALEARLAALLARGAREVPDINDGELSQLLPIGLGATWGHAPAGRAIRAAAAFLADDIEAPLPRSAMIGYAVLPGFGRAMAFLATREAYAASRASLSGLARAYAESAFARGMTVRVGRLRAEPDAAIARADASGASWTYREGTSRYVVRCTAYDPSDLDILEAFTGEPRLPRGTTLVESETLTLDNEREALLELLAELDARGPVPYLGEDAEALAALAHKPLAEAQLLVLGLPRFPSYEADFLGKALREKVGIKVQDAKAARASLKQLDAKAILALLGAAFDGVSARDLHARSTPARDTSPAAPAPWIAGLARGFGGVMEGRVVHRPELVEEAKRIAGYRKEPTALLGPLLDADAPDLTYATRTTHDRRTRSDGSIDAAFVDIAADLWPHLALTLPAGDPYLRGMPAAHARLVATLTSPDTLLSVGSAYPGDDAARDALLARVGGAPVELAVGPDETAQGFDNGAGIAVRARGSVSLYVRTHAIARPEQAADVLAIESILLANELSPHVVGALRFFFSDACARLMARLAGGAVPEGRYDADPRLSAPAATTRAKQELGLSEGAAVLYLELLALPAPTDRFVMQVNDWSAKELAAAGKELLGKKLVIEGKRERAGREVFLPGGWEKRSGAALPVETWKLPFYAQSAVNAVREPIGELYARALERALGEDKPRFEDVSAVRKSKGKKG